MNNEAIIIRIKTLIKEMDVTQNDFADRVHTDRSNLSKHLNGKLPISESLVNKIVIALGVSKKWLLNGEGEQYFMASSLPQNRVISLSPDAIHPSEMPGAKVFDIDVTAGRVDRDIVFTQDDMIGVIDVPFIDRSLNIVKVSGNSMTPIICHGDMVAIRPITNMSLLFWGQIYVVILDDYRMVKYVRRHTDPQKVILRSENPDYDDLEIYKTDIRHLFIVEHIIRFDTRL